MQNYSNLVSESAYDSQAIDYSRQQPSRSRRASRPQYGRTAGSRRAGSGYNGIHRRRNKRVAW